MHTPGRTRTGPREQGRPVEVVLRWGGDVVDVRRLQDDAERLRVGSRVEDDLCIPLDDVGSFDLLVRTAGGFELRTAQGMRGSIRRGDEWAEVSPSMGAFIFVRTDGDAEDVEARLVLGAFVVEVRVGERARGVHLAPLFDALWANTATVTMLAMAALVAVASLMPRGMVGDDEDLFTDPARITRLLPVTRSGTTTSPPPPSSERSASRPETTRQRPVAAEPAERAEQRVARASARAALALDAVGQDGGFGSALGRGGVADALVDALAAVHGTESAELGGSGSGAGIVGGLRPTGSASGALGVGTIGIGRVGTRGRGLDGYGAAAGGLTTKTERDVPAVNGPGVLEARGFYKELIRRVVKEHEAQVRYCYERALQRRPGLAGKVTVQWVIDAEGRASQAQARGFDDDVDDCLERRVDGWRFPKVGVGAPIVVSYPFVFKPT